METVDVIYRIVDGQDGSASLRWYLTEEAADAAQESDPRPFDENFGSVETVVGSATHKEAVENG